MERINAYAYKIELAKNKHLANKKRTFKNKNLTLFAESDFTVHKKINSSIDKQSEKLSQVFIHTQ